MKKFFSLLGIIAFLSTALPLTASHPGSGSEPGAEAKYLLIYQGNGIHEFGIRTEMGDKLKEINTGKWAIKQASILPGNSYMILYGKDGWSAATHEEPVKAKIRELRKVGVTLKQAAMGKSGSYVVLYNTNDFAAANVPKTLMDQLNDIKTKGHEIKNVCLRTNGSWVVLFGKSGAAWNSIPDDLANKIKELNKKGVDFKQVEVDDDGNYVILYDKNGATWKGIPSGLAQQIQSVAKQDLELNWASWESAPKPVASQQVQDKAQANVLGSAVPPYLNPANCVEEAGCRMVINGVQCLATADGSSARDEIYMDVYLDGKYAGKIGPRSMNENSDASSGKSAWQMFTSGQFIHEAFDMMVKDAKEEYWLMPGAFYFKNEIRFDLWEEDGGKNHLIDADDRIGSFTVRARDPETQFQVWDFDGDGKWRVAYTKTKRYGVDPSVTGNSPIIPVRDPVGKQEGGSCVAWSVTTALAAKYLKAKGLPKPRNRLFDAQAFYNWRDDRSKEGWWIDVALKKLLLKPIPIEDGSGNKLQLLSFLEYSWDGSIKKYYVDNGIIKTEDVGSVDHNGKNKMRAVLKSGEVLMCDFMVYPDFWAYAGEDGLYGGRVSPGKEVGGHAVVAVGYSNPSVGQSTGFPYWVVQNSWGQQWGKDGECKVAENSCGIDDLMYQIGEFKIVR